MYFSFFQIVKNIIIYRSFKITRIRPYHCWSRTRINLQTELDSSNGLYETIDMADGPAQKPSFGIPKEQNCHSP
jgi:hypothetical protein